MNIHRGIGLDSALQPYFVLTGVCGCHNKTVVPQLVFYSNTTDASLLSVMVVLVKFQQKFELDCYTTYCSLPTTIQSKGALEF